MSETPAEEQSSLREDRPSLREDRQSTPFLVLQFFIFPMAIVAVCVAVFVVFGLISAEGKNPRQHLAEVRAGGGLFNIKRWQAAFALANALEAERDLARKDPAFVDEVVALYEESKEDDPLVRRYLALALGRLGDRRAVPVLTKTLDEGGRDTDSQTLIYAIWALGSIGDPASAPTLLRLAGSEDRGVRKTAVHALGVFPGEEPHAALARALDDAADDVRWNAAVALARRGDGRATPVLLQMMDRAHLSRVEVPSTAGTERLAPDQVDAAVLQAVSSAPALSDPALRAALESLRAGDPSLKVREAARIALDSPEE
ncbi:MAG: HEAT repeat domain-containing protein [Acidobacteria bacterium]|nr:HEAT repeat domain-containing protein [Acidobacteriota bacterium]